MRSRNRDSFNGPDHEKERRMHKHAGLGWITGSCWLALVILGFASGAAGQDWEYDQVVTLSPEEEVGAQVGADCHTRETDAEEEEQCKDAAQNLEKECSEYCAGQGADGYELVVPHEPTRECGSYGIVAVVSCKISGAECYCITVNSDDPDESDGGSDQSDPDGDC
jgi:hypothetical protein